MWAGGCAAQLRAIRELLAQREITFSAYQSAFTAHQRKQADHAKATGSGNASKAAKIEVALKKVGGLVFGWFVSRVPLHARCTALTCNVLACATAYRRRLRLPLPKRA